MAKSPSTPSNPLSGQVMFYANPEPLDSKRHAKLGMRSTDRPFTFAVKQHFIPLHVGEFGPAGLNFPIVFAGPAYTPLAVMGLNDGENLFISEDGLYRGGVYAPAFLRRYPFVVAKDDQANRMVVCIDRASDLFTEDKPDVALFENGEPTEFTKNCIEFCTQFDLDRARTESFVNLLKDLDLFEAKQTNYTPRLADGTNGPPQLIAEYSAVSETKLNALPAEKLAELRDSGALTQIYAHLMSLMGFDRLVFETIARQAAAATPQAANA
jgi:hypothetical protein